LLCSRIYTTDNIRGVGTKQGFRVRPFHPEVQPTTSSASGKLQTSAFNIVLSHACFPPRSR
jgi:hypothetical protein